ncbi:MAG: hypothetical protein P1U56_05190 [Saprospiraceae bacterium]|nr:hypothetical protein [Saprospiraceae bacterium]
MKKLKSIGIGFIIWVLEISIYTVSFYFPILEDLELQANILQFLGVLPLVWFEEKQYFRIQDTSKRYWLGVSYFLLATVLDALFSVFT